MSIKNLVEIEIAKGRILREAFSNTPSREFVAGTDYSVFSEDSDERYLSFLAIIEECVAELGESEYKDIRIDYTSIACGTSPSDPLPYESIYYGTERLLKRDCCIEVARLYEKFGFTPAEENSNEPEDFLPTLLDCLIFLYSQTLEAYEQHELEACLMASWSAERFKREHLGNWIPQYCKEARQIALTNYYQGMLGILERFSTS